MFRNFLVMILGISIIPVAQAQIKLEGDVYSSTNIPVADAMILLRGSVNNITVYNTVLSDSLGHFSIIRPNEQANQLLVRGLGYKQKTILDLFV